MMFTTTTSRRLLTVAALFVAASTPSLAAEPQVQRIALSCAGAAQAMGCAQSGPSTVGHSAAPVRTGALAAKPAKLPASRKATEAQSNNDGSRFQYDSCGCSGS